MTINFELLKVSKMSSLSLYTSSHGEARNIKFGQQVNPFKGLHWYSPSEIVMSLPNNHVTLTNPLSLVTEGLLLSNLCSKNNSLIEIHKGHFHWGSNVIT